MEKQSSYRAHRAVSRVAGTALALLLVAGQAGAQSTSEKRDHTGDMTNPCNGEQVVYEGFVHMQEKTTASGDSIHFQATYRFQGQGAGKVTQLKYTVGGLQKINGKFPPGPITTRSRTKVVSNGPADNFHSTFVFHANGNGVPTTTRIESDCNGSSKGGK